MLVSAASTPVESACRQAPGTLQAVCLCIGSRNAASTDRASSQLLHGARQRPTQGACSSLPLALRWRVLAARHHALGTRLSRWACYCNGSGHAAPTDRASLQLLHRARRRPTQRPNQGACSCLCLWPSGGQRLPPAPRHNTPVGALPTQRKPCMQLRLIEQACGCSTVRGRGRLKVRARQCRRSFSVESACHQDRATIYVLPLQRQPP